MNLDLAAVNSGNGYEAEEGVKSYGEMLRRIHALAKPVFALVEGEVKAGGVGIVCACDAVLAAETASFELGEVLFGLIPANVLPYLLLRITPQKARYLMLTAKKVDAAEARTIGLADEVFPVQVIEKSVRKILKNVCRSSPDALAEGKRFTARLLDIPFPEQLDPAVNQLIKMLKNNDIREGIRSFQSGNLPPWFGKFSPKNPISLQMEEKE
jgi:enoyl-CoA hydratase/carnithine racemase